MALLDPAPPPDELDKGFLTYANYAAHLAGVIRFEYGSAPCQNIADAVRSVPAVQRIQRRRGEAVAERQSRIALHARQAWATETRLRWSVQQDTSITPFLLPGAPGDAYYAVYHGYLALLAARGNDMPTDHAATRHTFASDVCERRIFPYPWSVACKGPSTPDDAEWVGLPGDSSPLDVSNLSTSTSSNASDGLCKVIRTPAAENSKGRATRGSNTMQRRGVDTGGRASVAEYPSSWQGKQDPRRCLGSYTGFELDATTGIFKRSLMVPQTARQWRPSSCLILRAWLRRA